MSEKITHQELARLLRTLKAHDLEAIGRRLGLDLHGDSPREQLLRQLADNEALRQRVGQLALSLSNSSTCSFCGKPATRVVTSPSGASICAACVQKLR